MMLCENELRLVEKQNNVEHNFLMKNNMVLFNYLSSIVFFISKMFKTNQCIVNVCLKLRIIIGFVKEEEHQRRWTSIDRDELSGRIFSPISQILFTE